MHANNNRRKYGDEDGEEDEDEMMGGIDSSGKQKLADIKKSLR